MKPQDRAREISPKQRTVTSKPSRLTSHVNQSLGSYDLVLSAVVFGLFGWWLDRRFETTPILMLTLTLLGFVGAGLSLYYRYRAQIEKLRAETEAMREASR